jgi:hypothetical protein
MIKRTPFIPFNAEGIYLGQAPGQKIAQPAAMLSRWSALNARMRNNAQIPL